MTQCEGYGKGDDGGVNKHVGASVRLMRGRLPLFALLTLAVFTAGCLQEIGGEETSDAAPENASQEEGASQEQKRGEGGQDEPLAEQGDQPGKEDNATPIVDDGQDRFPWENNDGESSPTAYEDNENEEDEDRTHEDTQDAPSDDDGEDGEGPGDGEEEGESTEDGEDPDEEDDSSEDGDDLLNIELEQESPFTTVDIDEDEALST